MKRILILFLTMLALTACGGTVDLDKKIGESPIVYASPVADEPITLSATSRPTFTPTRVMSPTVDYAAKVGAAQLDLQYSLGTATMAAVTEQVIVKTSTALQGSVDATQSTKGTAEAVKMTRTVAVTQTAEAQAVQTSSAAATGTTQAPITQKAQVEANWAPVWQVLLFGGVFVLFLLALYYGAQLGYQWVSLAYEQRMALRQPAQQIAAPAPHVEPVIDRVGVVLDRRDKYGWGSVDITSAPVAGKTLSEIATLMTTGSKFTQAQMTGAGRPLVKDGSYNEFGEWLVKNYIAVKIDGRYSITHPEFFEQVLNS